MTTATSAPSVATRRFPITWPAWGWATIGVVAVWLCIMSVSSGSAWSPLSQALSLAPYLVLVSLGQMLVITLGPGNIDVSVGTVISMAAYVSVSVGSSAGALAGVIAAILAGAAAAVLSVLAILVLRVPPIIATLATSLVVTSLVLILADANRGGADASLRAFVTSRVLGIPSIAWLALVVTLIVAFVLKRTTFGRSVAAIGQSAKAAAKAGLRVRTVTAVTYLLSGTFAGLTGGVLSAYISPSTVLGTSYMLDSIAVVVIGGTLIAGGRPVVTGVWAGALFFVMLSSLLNLVGWSVGEQNILKGLLVVLVVVVSSGATGTGKTTLRRLREMYTPTKKEKVGDLDG
ncbi:monosaccharide ABC transporter membrane protein, CUT2 family [Paramicrobacterium humi]|uniref:Monosaccharide ABC transporter membrane protein, CUT2 family n=1 Tax=Paramicrobacterium humi TaxID=640635 RepID=A0A1H4KYU6_9MICO|nr:ABC transporter permease [Microbacterium humi]SEB63278.1 monosaccharide ABC transporter membrane protein, CUT2 family [Microbacterium humi]